jgi:uncharacterized RDD family membrane protein YckC
MAKQRFRDVKKGKITHTQTNAKRGGSPSSIFPDKRTRSKAFITDSFMLLMPIMYIVFYLVMGGREGFAANKMLGWVYILVPLVFVQIVFLAKNGQTPGMRAYNIKLVDSGTMRHPTFVQVVIRQILAPFSRLLFGWIFMYLRHDHRQPQELISRTALIRTNDPSKEKTKT